MAKRPGTVVLELSRVSFPHLWEKTASVEGGKEKYRLTSLLDPSTSVGARVIKSVQAEIQRLIKEAWGANAQKVYDKLPDDRKCLRDGNDELDKDHNVRGGYADMMFLTATSDRRVQVLDRDKTPLSKDDDKIYAGCYADVVVSIWVNADSKKRGGYGVFASLELVRFRKGGEPFGASAVDADDYLEDLEEEEEGEDALV